MAKAAPGAVAGAMQHPEKMVVGSKVVPNFGSGNFEQGPTPPSGYTGVAASKVNDWRKDGR
ncbi:MAG: hypothetical protein CL942_10990 [Desulfovibrio sp.]|nr:hypothetical protein [Desulfovibrio sp.]|tara:strand:- start:4380 stop:4562 length:183 start_codon:yes stop_codon:yes gene_type:complete